MDNAIRAALDNWLPLIKGLSFDERVGFLTSKFIISPESSGEYVRSIHNFVRVALTELQNEALKQNAVAHTTHGGILLSAKTVSKIQAVKDTILVHRTPEQIAATIQKIAAQGTLTPKMVKRIARLAKELERVTGTE